MAIEVNFDGVSEIEFNAYDTFLCFFFFFFFYKRFLALHERRPNADDAEVSIRPRRPAGMTLCARKCETDAARPIDATFRAC